MVKSEFLSILWSVIFYFSLLSVVPILYFLKVSAKVVFYVPYVLLYRVLAARPEHEYWYLFIFLLASIIYYTAGVLGISAFKNEHQDQAFEYLLSFPVTKKQILIYKIIPRLALLSAAALFYEILAIIYVVPLESLQGSLFFLFHPVYFPVCFLFIFFAGVFVSLFEQKNWVAVVSVMILISTVVNSLVGRLITNHFFNPVSRVHRNGLGFIFGVLVVLLILGLSFFSVYKRFDVKSLRIHGKRFVLRTLPLMAGLTILGLAILIL